VAAASPRREVQNRTIIVRWSNLYLAVLKWYVKLDVWSCGCQYTLAWTVMVDNGVAESCSDSFTPGCTSCTAV
jgi:hypothetical protein